MNDHALNKHNCLIYASHPMLYMFISIDSKANLDYFERSTIFMLALRSRICFMCHLINMLEVRTVKLPFVLRLCLGLM